jgi:LmbE family N-acetylglucosaminyl deacetylase
MKVMAVMSHPDDAEVWAGGALAKHVAHGHKAHIVVMTYKARDGRGREAREGARRLGCTIDLMGYGDTRLRDTDDAADGVAAILARELPQVVILHNPDDTHPDHEASFLVARRALIRWYAGPDRPPEIPSVFAAGTYRGMGLRGPVHLDTFVDITSVWEKKVQALLAHSSQQPDGWIPHLRVACEYLGARTGCALAEGFRRLVLFSEPGLPVHLDPGAIPETDG